MSKYFLIDFDSTIVQVETLDVLANIALKNHPDREKICKKVEEITTLGMEGKISFDESLKRRLALMPLTQQHIDEAGKYLLKKISPSIKENKSFFTKYKNSIYIISGGFREIIAPIALQLGILPDHIIANTFVVDKKGKITGVDASHELSQKGGKGMAVRKLNLGGEIFVIGDGYTDYEIVESEKSVGKNIKFIAYTETVYREIVARKADYVVPNFNEFLYVYNLPRKTSYPKNRISVLLLENINDKAISKFEKEGYAVEYYEKSLRKDELIEKIATVNLLGIRSRTLIDADVLHHAHRLLSIGAFCIGTDQVDMSAARINGVAVFNAPYSNTRSVMELVLGEMIILARGAYEKSNKMHTGVWDKSAVGAFELRGKTLGIIGYGNIGSQLSILAEAFGMQVIYYDIAEKLALGSARGVSLKELLRVSDIISVHVDGRKENKNLLGDKEFSLMKNGVIFLNLSRGSVVDIDAVYTYLKNGKIKGAAFDVFPIEPEGNTVVTTNPWKNEFTSKLRGIPNVILTPHIGGSTKEAQENIGEFVSAKLIEYINTGSTTLNLSLPDVYLPPLTSSHRFLHIHQNVPGILAHINKTLAKNQINIVGQYLKTSSEIGYVITDVNKKYNATTLQEMQKIPGTIKFRVLW